MIDDAQRGLEPDFLDEWWHTHARVDIREEEFLSAEFAVAKHLKRGVCAKPSGILLPSGATLWSRYTHWQSGVLCLREEDRDEDWFVLVTGAAGTYYILGCIRGADGKKDDYWMPRFPDRGAWVIPAGVLKPLPAEWRLE